MSFALVVHGHFYQPPRENPWTDSVEREPSAAPFHDWNARIHAECYRANAFARIHDRAGNIERIVNNYERLSYNFGPTLARWIERNDPRAHQRLFDADDDQRRRLGTGGAIAQAYAHPILPLAAPADRRTQIAWGLADFRRRFGRPAEGLWCPETAADGATLAALIDAGVSYTILAPEQVAAVREPGQRPSPRVGDLVDGWTQVDRDTVDTGRAYRWMHPDGSGRSLAIAVFDGPMSRGIAFGEATRDAATFVATARASALRSKVETPLVLCASDGELFGHHKKFADLNLAFTSFVEGPRQGIQPTNLGAYLRAHPPTWEMKLNEGPDGRGTAWSCAHGVGRWWRDCGCAMVPAERGWNQRWRTPLREALDVLQRAAAAHFEDAGASLLVDPWGARDAYGDVVDAPLAVRDEALAAFGTPELQAGRGEARDRARLLLELQRATLLMYASCGFYFDDIAGHETGLVIRLAAHAADLLGRAGKAPPVEQMLDLLAGAHSNHPGEGTGADVFRQVSADRVSPRQAAAVVAVGMAVDRAGTAALSSPGFSVEIVNGRGAGGAVGIGGALAVTARVTDERTGAVELVPVTVTWGGNGTGEGGVLRLTAGGDELSVSDLGRESRHRLLPALLPRLLEVEAPLAAAHLAVALGKDVVGFSASPEDQMVRQGYARLLIRLLEGHGAEPEQVADVALSLLDAAGAALAVGTSDRQIVEELVAGLGPVGAPTSATGRLAHRLGFVVP
jgi:hypothetical protein